MNKNTVHKVSSKNKRTSKVTKTATLANNKSNPNRNKPVYEQWWFWVVIVIVIGAIMTGSSSNKNNTTGSPEENQETSQEEPTKSKDEYGIGEIINSKKTEYVITGVDRNYDTGNMFVTPDEGFEYIKVNIGIRNLDKNEEHYYASDWEIIDGSGVVRSSDYMATSMANGLNTIELTSGGKISTSIVFSVRSGDTALILRKKSSILGIEQFIVKL